MVWYFCLFKNFPQFAVIHTVKGFRVINEAEVDLPGGGGGGEFRCFSRMQQMLVI